MAKEYDNELTGVLFVNERKTTDKQPDRQGECQIDGRKYRVAGWLKESRNGKKFLSLKFTPEDEDGVNQDQRQDNRPPAQPPPANDDIPF